MEELLQTLARQISYGLQFGEKSEAIMSRQQVQDKARDLALQLIDALPEIKRLLYTDVQAMFDNDPAAINYGEIIFSYPVTKAMINYRIAHKLHELQVPVIPRIITELAHSETGIDIHPGSHHRGQRHHLQQCQHPGPYHHRPRLCDWRQYLGDSRCGSQIPRPAVEGRRKTF
jgi:hypothetical protein